MDGARAAVDQAVAAGEQQAEQLRGAASAAIGTAAESVGGAIRSAGDLAAEGVEGARKSAQRAMDAATDMVTEHPARTMLVVAGAAAMLGFVAGMLFGRRC